MKHLKSWKLFESQIVVKTREQILEDIREIFLSELDDVELPAVDMDGEPTGEMTVCKLFDALSGKCWKRNSDLEVIPMTAETFSLPGFDGGSLGDDERGMLRCGMSDLKNFIVRVLTWARDNSLNLEMETVTPASHEDRVITFDNLEELIRKETVICALSIRVNENQ